ncbi:hypothetical protein LCGC14_1555830 [marine sediment metagenome]|uniref:Hemerythrin-like domain-containing protein n=1 Tax=marine sediment metagenome TaxID=412755 RepID=A0A0F9INY4_9ZZZZ
MIEALLDYVNQLEEEYGLERYNTLDAMKRFIFDDMVPHFIDEDIKYLKQTENPTRDLVSKTIARWEELCNQHPDYLNKKQIKDYITSQLVEQ